MWATTIRTSFQITMMQIVSQDLNKAARVNSIIFLYATTKAHNMLKTLKRMLPIICLPLPLTGRSAVAAHVISSHSLDLCQDRLGQLLHDVVLAHMLVPFEGLIQRLLLAVL